MSQQAWLTIIGLAAAWELLMLYLAAVCFRLANHQWPDTFGELFDWILEDPESSELHDGPEEEHDQ